MSHSQTNIRGLLRENRRLETQCDRLQRDLAQTKAAMAVQADNLKRRIADLENGRSDMEILCDQHMAALKKVSDTSVILTDGTRAWIAKDAIVGLQGGAA